MMVVVATLLACASLGGALAPVRGVAKKSRRVADLREQTGPPHAAASRSEVASMRGAAAVASVVLASAAPCEAAGFDVVPQALAAYGHFAALSVCGAALATERTVLSREMMTEADFDTLAAADITYGLGAVAMLWTGYLRVVDYGKGWEFYQHEPVFWVKLTLVAIWSSLSLFPTIKIIQRAIAKRQEPVTPMMSAKLRKRMTSVVNAELLAILAIPLSATLMARGLFYAPTMYWQLGAAPVGLAAVAVGYKYVNEALTWTEDEA